MRIAVLYNKPSQRFSEDPTYLAAESDTEESAREVAQALTEKGADAGLIALTESTITDSIRSIRADLIFNLIEWTGVDTPLAMAAFDVLNATGIAYTGASKQLYFETCDKTRMKAHFDRAHLPTAPWQLFTTGKEDVRSGFRYPVLVKVALEHSSVGIGKESIAHSALELSGIVRKQRYAYNQPVFAEELLTGREFQVTLLEKNTELTVLPPAEIIYKEGTDLPFLSYASRWDEHSPDYGCSTIGLARLDQSLSLQIRRMCEAAYRSFGFRDYARFDIRCTAEGVPLFLEVNSNPGLGDDEEYGMTISYKAAGMSFADFVWAIVESAQFYSRRDTLKNYFRKVYTRVRFRF